MKRKRPGIGQVLRSWGKALTLRKRGIYDAIATTSGFLGLPFGGGYQVLDPGRKIINGLSRMLSNYSANELASLSLPQLRSLARRLERDNATARAAGEGFVAEMVGTGIALEPDTGNAEIDEKLKPYWQAFCDGCDVTGTRSIYELQGEAARAWFYTGEHIWRTPIIPDLVDDGRIPFAILPLDSEWIFSGLPNFTEGDLTCVAGIKLDRWGRAKAYALKNPEQTIGGEVEWVNAKEIIHGFEHRRALQNRGEPIIAPVIERIFQEGDLIDTELKAAVTCSGIAVVVTSEASAQLDDGSSSGQTTDGTESDPAMGIGVGSVARVRPGEGVQAFTNTRPGQQIAPFVQLLRGSISGAIRVSTRYLDRDYSRAAWSSQRADAQDQQRLIAPLREVFGHRTIGDVYVRALPYLCAKAGVPMQPKGYRLLPDGQPYVNPVDDIKAVCMAVGAGLTTWEAEISKRGGDRNAIWRQLAKEYQDADKLGLKLDLSGTNAPAPESTIGSDGEQEDPEEKKQDEQEKADDQEERRALLNGVRAIANGIRAQSPPVVNNYIQPPQVNVAAPSVRVDAAQVNVPQQAAPVVNVAAPNVTVEAPSVRNEIAAPIVNVATPDIHVAAPVVNVAAPEVTVENNVTVPSRTIVARPQRDGSVVMEPQE